MGNPHLSHVWVKMTNVERFKENGISHAQRHPHNESIREIRKKVTEQFLRNDRFYVKWAYFGPIWANLGHLE